MRPSLRPALCVNSTTEQARRHLLFRSDTKNKNKNHGPWRTTFFWGGARQGLNPEKTTKKTADYSVGHMKQSGLPVQEIMLQLQRGSRL